MVLISPEMAERIAVLEASTNGQMLALDAARLLFVVPVMTSACSIVSPEWGSVTGAIHRGAATRSMERRQAHTI
jgi:hypothetical protein